MVNKTRKKKKLKFKKMKGGFGGITKKDLDSGLRSLYDRIVIVNNKNTSTLRENNNQNTERILNNISKNAQVILDNNFNIQTILDEMKKTYVTPAAPPPSLFDEVNKDAAQSMDIDLEIPDTGLKGARKANRIRRDSTTSFDYKIPPAVPKNRKRERDSNISPGTELNVFTKRHNNQKIDPFLGPAPQPPPATPPATPATREDDLMNMDPVVTTNLKAGQPNTATNDMKMPLLSDEQEKKEDPLSGVNPNLWSYTTNPVTGEVIDNEKWSAALNASLKDLAKNGGKRKTIKRRRRRIHKKTKHKRIK